MSKTKVILTSRLSNSEMEYLKEEVGEKYEFIIPKTFKEEDILEDMAEDVEIIIGNYVTKDILDKTKAKFIQNPFAGVENFDFELLGQYDIELYNSHSNGKAVAEHALALMFSLARLIPQHDSMLREGKWNRDMKDINLFSTSLIGKTVGILGYGGIGRALGQLLENFDVKIMAMVRDKNREYEELDFIGDESDLDYILKESDFLVSTLPLTDKTKGLIDEEKINLMKKDAYIINVSRGPIIEEKALYNALKDEKIGGAAIDSWYNYPKDFKDITFPSKNYDFHKLNNIVMSPHRAAMVKGELSNAIDVVKNLKLYAEGKELKNRVNIKEGY